MRKSVFVVPLLLYASLAFGASGDAMSGVCTALSRVQQLLPIGFKLAAFFVLVAGAMTAVFFVLDRERNMMGRGLLAGAFGLAFFALFWALAEPAGNLIAMLQSAIGC